MISQALGVEIDEPDRMFPVVTAPATALLICATLAPKRFATVAVVALRPAPARYVHSVFQISEIGVKAT
jgi:hypothetical protein